MRSSHRAVSLVVLAGFCTLAATALAEPIKPMVDKPAVLTFKTSTTTLTPGGEFKIDVFVANAADVSGYQLKLNVKGGDAGNLILKGIVVDQNRSDFLFRGSRVINTTAPATGEVVAIRYEGTSSIPASKTAYLATFTLAASPDAKGKFKITVDTTEEATLITGPGSPGKVVNGPAAEINIAGQPNAPVRDSRGKTERS
ncbi:MAG: hypothetical protein J5J06_14360 [Phycisphaerae bacterium]|nr:hypothetical protein [Phycisphaerae bacterium]